MQNFSYTLDQDIDNAYNELHISNIIIDVCV